MFRFVALISISAFVATALSACSESHDFVSFNRVTNGDDSPVLNACRLSGPESSVAIVEIWGEGTYVPPSCEEGKAYEGHRRTKAKVVTEILGPMPAELDLIDAFLDVDMGSFSKGDRFLVGVQEFEGGWVVRQWTAVEFVSDAELAATSSSGDVDLPYEVSALIDAVSRASTDAACATDRDGYLRFSKAEFADAIQTPSACADPIEKSYQPDSRELTDGTDD